MENCHVKKKPKSIRLRVVPLILLLGLICGCQAKEPPLSPGAVAFKQEINECITKLVKPLIEPVLKKDTAAINETLKQIEPEAIRLCRMCPFRIGVMNIHGDTLAVYPPQKNAHLDFHNYEVVQQTLKTRKIAHQRLFLQGGASLYVVCAPLIREDQVIGMLAIALNAAEAKSRWGLSEPEFLTLDFNR